MSNVLQIDANRENAQHSTGPKTPEGKKISSRNAIRHGFTSQILVLTKAETPLYADHCREYVDEFRPKGKVETDFVQELADLRWAINRIRAQETNLLALETPDNENDGDMDTALAGAIAARENVKTLALFSIYEQRKMRAYEKTLKLLVERQSERKKMEELDLIDASRLRYAYEKSEPDYDPAKDGFVCSREELSDFTRRRQRKNFAAEVFCGVKRPE